MPVVLRLKRYVVLPDEWSSYRDWKYGGGLDGFLDSVGVLPADHLELLEAMGGLRNVIDGGFYSKVAQKTCVTCGAEKELDQFHWTNGSTRGSCRDCTNAQQRAARKS